MGVQVPPGLPLVFNIMFKRIKFFLLDVYKELKKVSWPTKNEIKESTVIVIIASWDKCSIYWYSGFLFRQCFK